MYQRITLAPGVAQEFHEDADFFRVMASAVSDLEIRFYQQGREVGHAEGVGAGYAERFIGGGFDKLRLVSATGSAVDFVVRLGNDVQFDAPPTGNVDVNNLPAEQGAHINGRAVVLASGVSTLLAANAARRFLLVQNNDLAVAVRITCDGTDPTAANGLRLMPGSSVMLLDRYPPTGAIKAIAESGAGCAVEVQEG